MKAWRPVSRRALSVGLLVLFATAAATGPVGADDDPIRFAEVTEAAGLGFVHEHGGSGRHYYPETMVPGVALVDYDADGSLDAFFVQGAPLPGYEADRPLRDTLYRGRGDGTYAKVRSAGVGSTEYGFGTATGDYDNDGLVDVVVTTLEGVVLYRNHGDGTFSTVTETSGLSAESMVTTAAFVDYDQDGWADLFVCRYMDYSLGDDQECQDGMGRSAYCSPRVYEPTHSLLFRNEADGSFADVTEAAGIRAGIGRALGVAAADYDGDGWVDLYVAADLTPNFLFVNEGDGSFREEALTQGVAYGGHGIPQAGMGVDAGDYDNDGRVDLVVTNFESEPNTLYRNVGGMFVDDSLASGVESATRPYLGWGVGFVDLDLDGLLDLFVVNGHVDDRADERDTGKGYPQPARVYANVGDGYRDVSDRAGAFFARRQVARGAAFGDHDDDGDTDVLVGVNDGPAVLLENRTRAEGSWVRLRLVGRHCTRDALGARVEVAADGMVQTRTVASGTSYLSDHDRRLLVGIGQADRAEVTVRWPCGREQQLSVAAGRTVRIREPRVAG